MEYWSTGVLGLKRITPLLNQSSSPIFVALEKLMFACCHPACATRDQDQLAGETVFVE